MNNIDKKISSYFDEDFFNIIYKDLKTNKVEIEEDFFDVKERELEEKNLENEIYSFDLNNYKLGSIGWTSRELEKKGIVFSAMKYISNDYNGPTPSYQVAFVKIIYSTENYKILGFQIANEKNIEERLNCIKTLIENNMGIKELAKAKIYSDGDTNPDLLNILALMAINKNLNLVDVKEIEALEMEKLVEKNAFLLDVREDYEFDAGHVKGAVNIPLRSIVSKLDSIPKDKEIFVYCRSGHRSMDAVTFLNSLGLKNAYNVKGGFIEISLNEYRKDKGNIEKSILSNYNFE